MPFMRMCLRPEGIAILPTYGLGHMWAWMFPAVIGHTVRYSNVQKVEHLTWPLLPLGSVVALWLVRPTPLFAFQCAPRHARVVLEELARRGCSVDFVRRPFKGSRFGCGGY